MPITPIELQQLYLMQNHLVHLEHAKTAAKRIATQAEDNDIHFESLIKDSTVVKSENVPDDNKIKEKKERRNQREHQGYISYRRKKRNGSFSMDSIFEDDNNIEIEEVNISENIKGSKLDFFG